ncbi:hypothetical protein E2K93_10645 [Thalassotalea sp. HSM 43]|uniref:hypothetical protein n=1 Tax=Thalassotalea sp. HSM 43 TaxID=2552945 RepID=UPI00107FE39B|nr:hypothetical protein [Thalassotalea sp. HSM 43]QBY04813.1 hypothetical protein E2K93_10645 [Thalassotalea sp. HSM 43]
MIRLWLLCFIIMSVEVAASDTPENLSIKGSFKFTMIDSSGSLMLGEYISSASEITSASACYLAVSADDDYFFSYPVDIALQKEGDILIPSFTIKALYIDENSNYYIKPIDSVQFKVADLSVNETSWQKLVIKNNTVLFDPTTDKGLLAFHHLTLGQPLNVELAKSEKPYNVRIEVLPLSQKTARLARKCMKVIDS